MKLLSLHIVGFGPSGWSSEKLLFGNRATQLFAENGSGKTPVVQAIVFALGYKADFRDDIVEHCERVILEVAVDGTQYTIQRSVKGSFWISVESAGMTRTEFTSEREFSRFLFSLWGLEDPLVTTVGNEGSHLYVPQLLPLLYLDQDHGYAFEYYSNNRFIKDQYPEVMRLLLGLGPKNPFDRRRERNELREKLEYLDRAVVRAERIMEELSSDIGGPRRPHAEIVRDLEAAQLSLEQLRESGGATENIVVEQDNRLAQLQLRGHQLSRERAELELRIRGFAQIKNEIEVEANTLSLNEEARRIFASFDAVCANENCGLFVRSSLSYGKSLLYLRDQIKDLERTNEIHQRRVDDISLEQSLVLKQVSEIRASRAAASENSSVAELVEVVAQLTERVIRLKQSAQYEAELAEFEEAYVKQLAERAWVQARLGSLEGNSNASDLELLRIRQSLAERIKYWLDVLNTSNVSREVQVDSDFNASFGGQRVPKFHGSTRTRVVLAIRTAAFELAASRESKRLPRFLILDTPRQQDISRADLANFIEELQVVATERQAQVVYSTTNHRYEVGIDDAEWLASFPGADHTMYLGTNTP
jgi:hypothetical protein